MALGGEFPKSIPRCRNLSKLDLSYNAFHGNLPESISSNLFNIFDSIRDTRNTLWPCSNHFKTHKERLKHWLLMGFPLLVLSILLHFTKGICLWRFGHWTAELCIQNHL